MPGDLGTARRRVRADGVLIAGRSPVDRGKQRISGLNCLAVGRESAAAAASAAPSTVVVAQNCDSVRAELVAARLALTVAKLVGSEAQILIAQMRVQPVGCLTSTAAEVDAPAMRRAIYCMSQGPGEADAGTPKR